MPATEATSNAETHSGSLLERTWGSLVGPARRVALGILTMIVLFGAALSVAIWRYDKAIDRSQDAAEERTEAALLLDAKRNLLVRLSLDGKGVAPRALPVPREVPRLSRRFRAAIEKLVSAEEQGELRETADRIFASDDRLLRIEKEQIFGGDLEDTQRGFTAYSATLGSILDDLAEIERDNARESALLEAEAADLAGQAKTLALIAALLGLAAALAVGVYVVRLLSRVFTGIRSTAATMLESSSDLRSA